MRFPIFGGDHVHPEYSSFAELEKIRIHAEYYYDYKIFQLKSCSYVLLRQHRGFSAIDGFPWLINVEKTFPPKILFVSFGFQEMGMSA